MIIPSAISCCNKLSYAKKVADYFGCLVKKNVFPLLFSGKVWQ